MGKPTEKQRGADAIRESILDAARARFERYGLNKTTMAEIASDCDMSAANLYRYFASKSEIAAAGAERWLDQMERYLRDVVALPGQSARDRLRGLIQARIAHLDALIARHSHLDELIGDICAERPDLTERHNGRIRAMIAEIVEEGSRSGEFRRLDAAETARAICWATASFGNHDIVRSFGRSVLEQAADGVIDLVVEGLAPLADVDEDGEEKGTP